MVNFSCVYNVNDYKASTDDERFAAAAKAASSNSQGGVVFFPKGSYTFKENIVLPNNVVIRGEPTTSPAKSGTKPGKLAPETKFQCPPFAHQGILSMDPKAQNIGVVNIELDACAVMLWPGLKSSTTSWKLKDYWYSATDVVGMGQNKLVLGNLVHDGKQTQACPCNVDSCGTVCLGGVYAWPSCGVD
jgi:polygalacturonase